MPIQRNVRRPRTVALQWALITVGLVIFSRLWDGDWSYSPFAIFYGIVAGAFQLQWNRRLRDNPELRLSRRARRRARER